MGLFDKIMDMARGVDAKLRETDTDRIGAEAERRGLFMAFLRNASAETLTGVLRDQKALFAHVSDLELMEEFARRSLLDTASKDRGYDEGCDAYRLVCEAKASMAEAERVARTKSITDNIRTLLGAL